jgi:hypothetical protein
MNYTTNNTTKKYNCIKCNKILSSRQSKWRHENTCNFSNSIDYRITQLEHTIIPSIDANIKHLYMLINNILSTYDIVKHNFFNKIIISNESHFLFIINNNIDIYFSISKFIPSHDRNIKYNLKYLNKIRSLPIKNNKYAQYAHSSMIPIQNKKYLLHFNGGDNPVHGYRYLFNQYMQLYLQDNIHRNALHSSNYNGYHNKNNINNNINEKKHINSETPKTGSNSISAQISSIYFSLHNVPPILFKTHMLYVNYWCIMGKAN